MTDKYRDLEEQEGQHEAADIVDFAVKGTALGVLGVLTGGIVPAAIGIGALAGKNISDHKRRTREREGE